MENTNLIAINAELQANRHVANFAIVAWIPVNGTSRRTRFSITRAGSVMAVVAESGLSSCRGNAVDAHADLERYDRQRTARTSEPGPVHTNPAQGDELTESQRLREAGRMAQRFYVNRNYESVRFGRAVRHDVDKLQTARQAVPADTAGRIKAMAAATPKQIGLINVLSAKAGVDANAECQRVLNCLLKSLDRRAASTLIESLERRLNKLEFAQ